MTIIREKARAKLNLTLRVLGRRADGFHALESLVAFAGVHDIVELEPGRALALAIEGPFARSLDDDNLVLAAARAARLIHPALTLGRFLLVKDLPVAAGLGGGSADAAAALRLIAAANAGALTENDMSTIAANLGSDVTVCLASRPALIQGRGEKVAQVSGFPSCGVLLANPGLKLATSSVYAELHTPSVTEGGEEGEPTDFGGSFEALIDYLLPRGNDLEAPATRLAPAIKKVLAALGGLSGARLARLSGSGPTCFALFATEAETQAAGAALAKQHPNWWIAASS